MKTAIFGHTSLETAYLIADYPYGRTLRCQRRVWLEYDPKKGVRFVAQTENPKNGRWNKPHMSTYMHIAGGLYLDTDSHVQWDGVGYHTSAEQALAFVQTYGRQAVGAERLRAWAIEKAHMCNALATGKAHFTVNGEKQERSEADKARDTSEAQVWVQVVEALKP